MEFCEDKPLGRLEYSLAASYISDKPWMHQGIKPSCDKRLRHLKGDWCVFQMGMHFSWLQKSHIDKLINLHRRASSAFDLNTNGSSSGFSMSRVGNLRLISAETQCSIINVTIQKSPLQAIVYPHQDCNNSYIQFMPSSALGVVISHAL